MSSDVKVSFGGEMAELRKSIDGMTSYVKGWGSTIKGIGVAAFGGWLTKESVAGLASLVSGANEAAAVQAKLESVIKATGGAAGFTGEQMADMAMDLRQITQVDDDVIKGAQTILATFKEVRGDQFERTTAAALDLATVLGGDASGAAMQLGKALNDPVKGMNMLAKSGVGFTDAQKAMVEEMVKAGDVAGAQGVILAEVEGQVGGAAAAVASAKGPWGELAMVVGDVRDAIGEGLNAAIKPFIPMIETAGELVREWAGGFGEALPAITAFVEDGLQFAVGWYEIYRDTAMTALSLISEMWANVFGESATGPLGSLWDYAKSIFTGLIELAVGYFSVLQTSWQNIPEVASLAWNALKLGAVTWFEDTKHLLTVQIPEALSWLYDNWREIFTDVYNMTATIFQNIWTNISGVFEAIVNWDFSKFQWTPLTEGFESAIKELPKISERTMTDLEKELTGKVGESGVKLANAYKENFDKNMAKIGFGADVADTTAPGAAVAAAAGAGAAGLNPPPRAVGGDDKDAKKKSEKESGATAASFEDAASLFKRIQGAAAGSSPELETANEQLRTQKELLAEQRAARREAQDARRDAKQAAQQGTMVAVMAE